MKKYKAVLGFTGRIEVVDTVKESLHFVRLPNGNKEAMRSQDHRYFDTFYGAKEYLISKKKEHIQKLYNALDMAKRELTSINNIKEDK